jgi:pimeloyl-ACP methyl ester carboxylesterase
MHHSTLSIRLLGKILVSGIFTAFVFLTNIALAKDAYTSFVSSVSGQGRNIVLIPGLMSDGRVWDKTAVALSVKNRVHIINIAGFGRTSTRKSNSIKAVKAELIDYISKLENPVVIGHSLGGFLGLSMAIDKPDAIAGVISVDGLPFIGPVFSRDQNTQVSDISSQAIYIKGHFSKLSSKQIRDEVSRGIYIQARSEKSKSVVLDMSSLSDGNTVGEMMYELMTTDLRASMHKIKADVLLLGASGAMPNELSKDQAENLYSQQFESLPSATVIMNRKAHHFIMLDELNWFLGQVNNFLGES